MLLIGVIMDKEQYIWEGNRQLVVEEHYCTLEEPNYPLTIINGLKNNIY